ncbi:hypothetical protein FJ957_16995 [Mesorhizobium sp. B2-4-6]|nr:hypothetical protein [Mesorhizobium sp. B4-1-1]TPI18356.1 hypothetical protein FJW10_19235 [Mesorhizobium sp. B4-1-1]TPL46444.1 hypothetical protein FJ957_16995 [Mesorhizobium sp. B2-4-6]
MSLADGLLAGLALGRPVARPCDVRGELGLGTYVGLIVAFYDRVRAPRSNTAHAESTSTRFAPA